MDGGGGGVVSQTLSSLGADLTFSVSWSVARELLDGASDSQLGEDELIGIVLGVSVVLTALPKALGAAAAEIGRWWPFANARRSSRAAASEEPDVPAEGSGLLAFLALFVSIAQRISISLVVQLLAANVRTRQPLRSVRILTLLSVAVFFLFLESTATVGRVAARKEQ
jgi:hypothetical protein